MWVNRFQKTARTGEWLAETTTIYWQGRWLRAEYFRKHFPGSPTPDINFAQIRDLEKNEIAGRCMEGFELHSAFAGESAVFIFTDYWNIYMRK
ncbi:MAG: hypothetical protein IT210_25710 [Armatimonadetes bacterium]|nr:hypothetical protein [Armatimonadota bacterium]